MSSSKSSTSNFPSRSLLEPTSTSPPTSASSMPNPPSPKVKERIAHGDSSQNEEKRCKHEPSAHDESFEDAEVVKDEKAVKTPSNPKNHRTDATKKIVKEPFRERVKKPQGARINVKPLSKAEIERRKKIAELMRARKGRSKSDD
ncbi:uncharacterized protein L199_004083 [Kwoniella botswanensis]|uniref:uncharacterized protein n=1 Tax=Kwoniella botswanensis TaxID=1268659 RepID=UPI00315DF65C